METYDIITHNSVVDIIEADSKEDALEKFAFSMDSDIRAYFDVVPHKEDNELTVLTRNDCGIIFKSNKLPSIFHVYILKGQCFKNGTCRWKIGIEHERDKSKYFIIDSVVGFMDDAVNKLKSLLK